MRQSYGSNNIKGQAMIIVIAVLVMLFIITMAFFILSQTERAAALRHMDSLRGQYIAEAGIVYAQKILELDKQANPVDSLQDLTFKNFEGQDVDLDGDGTNESRWFSLLDSQGNPFGRFSVKLSDEASRFNLNSSSAEILGRLFSEIGIDTSKLNQLLSRRPFNAKEELNSILGTGDFTRLKDFLTIYSRDLEIDLHKKRRIYLNSSQPQLILETFLNAGIKDSYEKAANLKDASDTDLAQTLLDKFSQTFSPTGLLEPGGWRQMGSFYEADPQDDSPGKFIWSNLALEDGEYLCFLYGPASTDVVAGDPHLFSGEGLRELVKVEGGSLTLTIKPAEGTASRFSYIELVSRSAKRGLNRRIITGTEALVISELMVKPSKEILIDSPTRIESGQTRQWTLTQEKPGNYYVVVEALTQGGLVGDVSISARRADNLRDGDYFPGTINVDVKGEITLQIKNNSLGDASFKGIKILQEPDAEFIEILNLSPNRIDLDNFSVEVYSATGELIYGWPAHIPSNTKIEPYQHLVLSVDNNDASPAPTNLQSNNISFYGIYNTNAVGLIFDEAASTINRDADLLPNSSGEVILRDASGERIDAVEYQASQIRDFTSLERGDPSAKIDGDGNGFFDGWYQSESEILCTPGLPNENAGMYTRDENGRLIKHNVSEINVFNRPLYGLTEVEQLSEGRSWKRFSLQDLALMADPFALEVIDLAIEQSHEKEGGTNNTGIWEFSQVPRGNYLLSILSDNAKLQGKEILVAIKTDVSADFTDLQPLLFMQGFAFYGTMEIPESSSVLQIKIVTDSIEDKAGLQKIRLEPVFSVSGRVNINTAKAEILRSLFISESLVNTIIQNRPIGAKDTRLLGVGELFLLDSGFVPFHNYLTVKSDVYEIKCRGDFLQQGKSLAYQTIRTVIERGD